MGRRRAAVAAMLLVTGLACAVSLTLIGVAWGLDVPHNWGFRGIWMLQAVLFAAPAAAVLWQRRHPYGWVLLGAAVLWALLGLVQEYLNYDHASRPSSLPFAVGVAWIFSWAWMIALVPMILVFALFPDGRYPSPRWRAFPLAIVVTLALGLPGYAFRPGPLENIATVTNPLPAPAELEDAVRAALALSNIALPLLILIAAAAPVVRFRRSSGETRQQLKWFAYAASILAAVLTINVAAGDAPPTQFATAVAMMGLPAAVGVAILRYRLYDVDVLINRTIVYGTLTAVLGVTYYAFVVLLQAVLRPVTGGSDVAVAISTLAVVALVQPLRRRMQETVDRRFYRSRYDAARALEAFATRLRDDVDLDRISGSMVDAVGRTVAPRHASLWLRPAPLRDPQHASRDRA